MTASDRAQAASGPVRTGRQDARGGSSVDARQHPAAADQVGGEPASSTRWVTDGARDGPVRIEAGEDVGGEIGVELDDRDLPLPGRGRARRWRSISSRTSCGESTGRPPRAGNRRVSVVALPPVQAQRGQAVERRGERMRAGPWRTAGPSRGQRDRGVLGPQRQPSRAAFRVAPPDRMKNEHS